MNISLQNFRIACNPLVMLTIPKRIRSISPLPETKRKLYVESTQEYQAFIFPTHHLPNMASAHLEWI
jgi:hypothetical protein